MHPPDRARRANGRFPRRRTALLVFAAGFCAFVVDPPSAYPQAEPQATESSIKGAYIFKFPGYVEWPDTGDTNEPFTIGVAGGGDVGREVESLAAGRTIQGRPIDVREVELGESFEDLEILFVGARERNRLDEWLLPTRDLPILTVTESEDALAEGSIINFTIDDARVRFEISLPTADRSGLRLDARLLAVAQRVEQGPE